MPAWAETTIVIISKRDHHTKMTILSTVGDVLSYCIFILHPQSGNRWTIASIAQLNNAACSVYSLVTAQRDAD